MNEWYNFQPIQRYKALTAEEAEEEFGRRKKCVNLWSMKMRMKLKHKDEEEVEDPEDKAVKGSKGGDKKKLMISEMDEWMDSDDMSSQSEGEGDAEKKKKEEDSDDDDKGKKKKGKAPPKKKKKDVNDEAFEVSLIYLFRLEFCGYYWLKRTSFQNKFATFLAKLFESSNNWVLLLTKVGHLP